MKFLQYKDSTDWWEWPEGDMTVYNINGGWHEINENSEAYMYGKVVQAENWAELCRKEKYNPWHTAEMTREMWIDPDGVTYDCGEWGAHEATAQMILEKYLGEIVNFWDCGDRLIQEGWIKVSVGPMCHWYFESNMYDAITDEQWEVLEKWKERYGIKY